MKMRSQIKQDDYSGIVLLRDLFQCTDREISKMFNTKAVTIRSIIRRWNKDIEWYDCVVP